jgi:hypothetical protein
MIRGKGTQAATGVLVLLFAAGSASAVPTFPVCLRGPDTLRWMTDRPIFDAVLIAIQGRDTRSPTPETLPVSVPRDQTDTITISSSAAPLMTAGQISVGDTTDKWSPEFRGTTCEIPSPGTLLLGAMGAFLVGALRMRRML